MRKIFILLSIILFASSLTTAQEYSKRKKHHAFSGTLMISTDVGLTLGYTDYSSTKPQVVGRGAVEYFFPTTSSGIFGLKGFISAGYVGGKDSRKYPTEFRASITRIGGGITYTFSIKQSVFPYVFLGSSYGWVNPEDNNGITLPYGYGPRNFKITGVDYHGEFGLRFLLSNEISLNVNIGAELSSGDRWDGLPPNGSNDMLIQTMAGFSYSFFTQTDEDGDGIPDSKDQCPNTPPGVKVDDFGCPIDSDHDGVPDKYDKCPNTPAGMKVNENGCPDSDNDGVYDDQDKCPNTPEGAPVDATGCPKDSDGDGVPDYKDECPNTPKGREVDEKGCEIKRDTVKVSLSGDTNFESGKAVLLSNAFPVLNNLVESMNKDTKAKLRIEGYTDSIGSESYNLELSRKRAQAVADYLISQGINPNRLQVVPMGESNPIASNKTAEGRAMNRRVEIIPEH